MDKDKIERINELARKKKTSGLSAEETAEQEALRRQYLSEFRAGLQSTLDNVYIKHEDGTCEKLSKKC